MNMGSEELGQESVQWTAIVILFLNFHNGYLVE
jgi:hypothetical protein